MSSHNGTISRQSQTNSFIQAVHRIGGKHTRTRTTCRTSISFYFIYCSIVHITVCCHYHSIHQIESFSCPLTSFHRTTTYKYSRNIKSHSCHQHSRRNLITIAYAHHSIYFVSIAHILYTVGYNIARRQRIKHTIMPHSYTVIYCNSIKFSSKTAFGFYLSFYFLSYFMQMRMSGYKLRKGVDDGNNRFSHLFTFHSISQPETTCSGHQAPLCYSVAS